MKSGINKKQGLLSTFELEYTALCVFLFLIFCVLCYNTGTRIVIAIVVQIAIVIAAVQMIRNTIISHKFFIFQHGFIGDFEGGIEKEKKLNRLFKPHQKTLSEPDLYDFLITFACDYYKLIGIKTESDRLGLLSRGIKLKLSEEIQVYTALHFGICGLDLRDILSSVTVDGSWCGDTQGESEHEEN